MPMPAFRMLRSNLWETVFFALSARQWECTSLDPVSGDSVLIAPASRLAPLFPGCEDELSSTDCTRLISLPQLSGKMRLIPYSAVGTESGMLAAFRPDAVYADGEQRDDVIVAGPPTPLGGDGFDSII